MSIQPRYLTVKYQCLYKFDPTLVHSKKSLLILKLPSFQNASIEIKQISFVYQQNRFTFIVVLMMADLILAFAKFWHNPSQVCSILDGFGSCDI